MKTLTLVPLLAALATTGAIAADYDVDRDILYDAPLHVAELPANDVDRDILYVAPELSDTVAREDIDRDILYPSEG